MVVPADSMHEFGHSLGLVLEVYGGIDAPDWPWKHNSVMNYEQINPWKMGYSSGGDFNDWEYLQKNGFTSYWASGR